MEGVIKISDTIQQKVTVEDLEKEMAYCQKGKTDNIKNLLNFYQRIFMAQTKALSEIKDSLFEIDESDLKEVINKGVPAFEKGKVKIDSKEYVKVLESICEAVAEDEKLKASLKKFLESEKIKNLDLSSFVEGFQKGDISKLSDLESEFGLKPETIFFVMQNALIPFYEKAAESARGKMDIFQWKENFCPICGSRPKIAKCRKDDGLKVLQCPLCRTQWGYPRLKCAYCENEEPKTLHYLFDEADKGHRVEVCDKCKKYLKVSDERTLEREVILEIEDIVTLLLDVVAQKKDYLPVVQLASELH